MTNIHFIHTSDWHLGFAQYNKQERFNDYYNAARDVVKKIIELKPHFVLHTGDLFHHQHPTPGAIRQAVRLLKILQKQDIPVYMVRGNHDAKSARYLKQGGDIISLLDDLGLIKYISDELLNLSEDVNLIGVGYYTGSSAILHLESIFEEYQPSKLTYDIISMHAFVEGQLKGQYQISLAQLSTLDVNYIGVGHYHIPWEKPKINLFAPGSSESTSSNDWQRSDNVNGINYYSSFYEVKSLKKDGSWSENEVTVHRVKVRPKVNIQISSDEHNLDLLVNLITDSIKEKLNLVKEMGMNPSHSIIKLDLLSSLPLDQLSFLSVDEILNQVNIFHLIAKFETIGQKESIEIKSNGKQNIENIIMELLGEDNDAESYLSIIIELIQKFGAMPVKKLEKKTSQELLRMFANIGQNTDDLQPTPEITAEELEEVVKDEMEKREGLEDWF